MEFSIFIFFISYYIVIIVNYYHNSQAALCINSMKSRKNMMMENSDFIVYTLVFTIIYPMYSTTIINNGHDQTLAKINKFAECQ